jgi:serralysin
MRTRTILGVLVGLLALTCSQRAEATFHLWHISQVYSNASGSVQYVDFVLPFTFDDESFLAGHQLSASLNSNSLSFGSNLPSVPVTGQHFLVATPGFDAIAGVTPDYTFPIAPFFNLNGDTLNYAGIDFFTFPALPSDGVLALNRDGSTAVNAPTNFAGQVGFVRVPEPATWVLLIFGPIALWAASRRDPA